MSPNLFLLSGANALGSAMADLLPLLDVLLPFGVVLALLLRECWRYRRPRDGRDRGSS